MRRALVVIDDTDEHRDLFAEAVEIVRGTGAELELFSWVTPDEFESDVETLEAAEQAGSGTYASTSANDIVTNFVTAFAREVCGSDVPEFDVSSAVTEDDAVAEHILDAARQSDCDHVFLVGRRRSPTGKVLFGDVAQDVILNFDGNVTVSMS